VVIAGMRHARGAGVSNVKKFAQTCFVDCLMRRRLCEPNSQPKQMPIMPMEQKGSEFGQKILHVANKGSAFNRVCLR
jgi:hypothetical protein